MPHSSHLKSERLIGVHLLAQIEFCLRAGLISAELPGDDTGEDEDAPPRLDYLPEYEEILIRQRLTSTMRKFWMISGVMLFGLLGIAFFARHRMELSVLCGVAMGLSLYWWFDVVRVITILRSRIDAAERTLPREPDEAHLVEESFNWWELRKAGYQVDRMPEPMSDPGQGVIGRPWRVLRKGNLRIPVFRKHRGGHAVHSQHRVRIAAYCHLIESCEGSLAPFGLVLFSGTYDVVLVPNNRANQVAFNSTIKRAHGVLYGDSGRCRPDPPARSACKLCPLGLPVPLSVVDDGTVETIVPLPSHPTIGIGGRRFHSQCGDRFGWIPPHEQAEKLRLTEA